MESNEKNLEYIIDKMNLIENQISDIMSGVLERLNPLKDTLKELEKEYAGIATEIAKSRLDNKPYKCGTANIHAGKYEVKVSVPKEVKWNENLLSGIEEMIISAGKNPKNYIKYKLSVAEKDYDSFPDEIKNVFKNARMVSQGKPKITIKLRED